MKKVIEVPIVEERLWMDADVVYGQVPGWCGVETRNLKMSVIYQSDTPRTVFRGLHPDRPLQKRPCLIFLCGGGWLTMDVDAYLPNFIELAKKGYVIASVEYLCSNAGPFPMQLEQIKSAIRYLRANADIYLIDTDKIGIFGESAGGHLSSLIGTTSSIKDFDKGDHLDQSSAVQAVCAWYGPTDMGEDIQVRDNPWGRLLWGDPTKNPELSENANPIKYVTDKCPPFLLLHGTADSVVAVKHSELMHDALEKVGVDVELCLIEGAQHADIHFFQLMVFDIMDDFFKRSFSNAGQQ